MTPVPHKKYDRAPKNPPGSFGRRMSLPSFWAEDGFHDAETGLECDEKGNPL